MKVGLILPGNIWFCPYVKIYTEILDKNNYEYEIISWNRDNTEPETKSTFNLSVNSLNRISKLIPFFKYLMFIKKNLSKQKYDKIIIFGPQLGILLYFFLRNKYKNSFIFDYRDLSIEQLPILNYIFKKLLSISSLNILSSSGFIKYLPKNDYVISHNFKADLLSSERSESSKGIFNQEFISVLTIGSIRDYEANLEVIKSLANKKNIKLFFVGKGAVSDMLKEYTEAKQIENVYFYGFYEKKEEADFIRNATFLNIYYPKIKSHSSAMSNRFYNSLIYKRPMVVTCDSIQGDYVEEYRLGLSLQDCENLYDKIMEFRNNFNSASFDESTNILLNYFKTDYENFYNKVLDFLKK